MHPPASASACLESWLVSTVRSPEKLRFPLVKYDQEAWKPGSTCLFSLQFVTSAFNVNVTWSAFLSTQIRIYLNLRRRADHEIALPAAVGLDGCFAYPSGRGREDADRHVQTCEMNKWIVTQIEMNRKKWKSCLLYSEKEWKLLTSWKRPKTPGDVSPPGSGILYGWCLQLGQVLLVAFGRRIAGSLCMLLWFRCFRGLNARYRNRLHQAHKA